MVSSLFNHKQGFRVVRAELIHVSDLASDLGMAKMHHRQEFEFIAYQNSW